MRCEPGARVLAAEGTWQNRLRRGATEVGQGIILSLNADVPAKPEVDGIIGAATMACTRLRIDHPADPRGRVIASCLPGATLDTCFAAPGCPGAFRAGPRAFALRPAAAWVRARVGRVASAVNGPSSRAGGDRKPGRLQSERSLTDSRRRKVPRAGTNSRECHRKTCR
jgi:hypothetical protein